MQQQVAEIHHAHATLAAFLAKGQTSIGLPPPLSLYLTAQFPSTLFPLATANDLVLYEAIYYHVIQHHLSAVIVSGSM
jgi:hypothetical protein